MRVSIFKPISVNWMVDLYDYFLAHPQIIKNGFKHVGITDFLAKQLIIMSLVLFDPINCTCNFCKSK